MKRPRRPQTKKDRDSDQNFLEQVRDKTRRKLKARQEEEEGIWYGLGMMGIVGWSIAIPTLIGIAIGIWLDSRFSDGIPWTLIFLLLGIVLGCLNAWYWIQHESREDKE